MMTGKRAYETDPFAAKPAVAAPLIARCPGCGLEGVVSVDVKVRVENVRIHTDPVAVEMAKKARRGG